MADKKSRIIIDDLRGGINGYDPPWAIAENECIDAVDVDFFRSRLGRRRGGVASGGFTVGYAIATDITWLHRHVPGTDDTAAELWAANNANEFRRCAAGVVFAVPTVKDALNGNQFDITAASINGK